MGSYNQIFHKYQLQQGEGGGGCGGGGGGGEEGEVIGYNMHSVCIAH